MVQNCMQIKNCPAKDDIQKSPPLHHDRDEDVANLSTTDVDRVAEEHGWKSVSQGYCSINTQ